MTNRALELGQVFMMHFVSKGIPTHSIDGMSQTKETARAETPIKKWGVHHYCNLFWQNVNDAMYACDSYVITIQYSKKISIKKECSIRMYSPTCRIAIRQ